MRKKGHSFKVLWLTFALLICRVGPARAEKVDRIVVLDFSAAAEGSNETTFCFAPPSGVYMTAAAIHKQCMDSRKTSSFRWFSRAGDRLLVVVLRKKPDKSESKPWAKIVITETARQSRFMSDLNTLAHVAPTRGQAEQWEMITKTYVVKHQRATIDVKADASVSADADDDSLSASIVAGPRESLFLSADLPLQSLGDLTLSDGDKIAPRNTPDNFYIGINYSFADILENVPGSYGSNPMTNYLALKAVVKATTTRPLEGYGFGIAARGFTVWGIDFDDVSPCVLFMSTRVTDPKTGGRPYARSWRVGASFNLSSALKWTGDK
jgi:hypothetical protein